jgi:hypothetical protein
MRATGYWVVTFAIETFEIRPPETVTETVTLPRRLVPVPVYVPSRYAVTDGALDPDAPTDELAATLAATLGPAARAVSAACVTAMPAR